MFSLPDNERTAFFSEQLIYPFAPMFEILNMPSDPESLACLKLSGTDEVAAKMLNQLKKANAWKNAKQAINLGLKDLQKQEIKMPKEILLGIFLGDPVMLAQSEGYTGSGSIPGYIQIMIVPNDYNIPRLPSCIVHEFHHNVLFTNVNWNFMNVTLSQYLAVEGLAESFASSLYGEEFVGPWVTSVNPEDLDKTKNIIGKNLDTSGFMEVRKYIFGDHPMLPKDEVLGIPYCGGYAIGYHAIQAYLNSTGKTVAGATKAFIQGVDIIKQSGYFK